MTRLEDSQRRHKNRFFYWNPVSWLRVSRYFDRTLTIELASLTLAFHWYDWIPRSYPLYRYGRSWFRFRVWRLRIFVGWYRLGRRSLPRPRVPSRETVWGTDK